MTKIERNRQIMARFKDCINTNDAALAEELIADDAEFASLISPEKLHGGKGYLSVVDFMRKSFSDIHWEIIDMTKLRCIGLAAARTMEILWDLRRRAKNFRSAR